MKGRNYTINSVATEKNKYLIFRMTSVLLYFFLDFQLLNLSYSNSKCFFPMSELRCLKGVKGRYPFLQAA